MDDDENYGARDDLDESYDKLDQLVESTKNLRTILTSSELKFDTSLDMITLMMEEAHPSDIKIYQQIGSDWVAEVKYRGLNFVHVNGKHKPEAWEEFENS